MGIRQQMGQVIVRKGGVGELILLSSDARSLFGSRLLRCAMTARLSRSFRSSTPPPPLVILSTRCLVAIHNRLQK